MIHRAVFSPNSLVVVGASKDTAKVGGKVLENILSSPFRGALYGINPQAAHVQGVPCPTLDDLPNVDLAIIAVPATHIPMYMEELAARKQTRGFIVLSAGFSEMGPEGAALQKSLVDIADRYGASLIGPNCTGVLTRNYAGIFAGPIPELSSDGCDLASGSGATAAFLLEQGITMGVRFSQVITVGNSAQIGVEEVVAHWDESYVPGSSSRVKVLYMESITRPQKLLAHCISLIAKGCRICAVKAGSSSAGSRAASSHTGAMAGNDEFTEALFRKAGVIRCRGREELITVAAACMFPPMEGNRMAVVTHAGGPGVMLTDALSSWGIEVPKLAGSAVDELEKRLHHGSSVANPIDFLATGTAAQLGDILTVLEDHVPEIDAVSVIFGSPGLTDIDDVLEVLSRHVESSRKPVFPILPSTVTAKREIAAFISRGMPCFPDDVVFGDAIGRIRSVRKLEHTISHVPHRICPLPELHPDDHGYLPPHEAAQLLDLAGIPRVQETWVSILDDLDDVDIPFPWAMKGIGIIHKSDSGAVVLGIRDGDAARKAAQDILAIPGITGMLIQEMAEGMEFFCGVSRDDQFGHMLMAGLGGVFVETLKDTASELVPVQHSEAEAMLRRLRSWPIIQGVRGQPGLDRDGLIDIMVNVSSLVSCIPEICEMDINPVMVSAHGAVSVDCRIRLSNTC